MCFVLCIIIVVEGADDGISLVGGVLYGRGGIVLAIIREDRVLMLRRHISEPYIADAPLVWLTDWIIAPVAGMERLLLI